MRSLFDRIIAPQTAEQLSSAQMHKAYVSSIEMELDRLLNTRSHFSGFKQCATNTILDYGVEDLVSSGEGNQSRLSDLIQQVHRAITVYEPRLSHVRVQAEPDASNPLNFIVRVKGRLKASNSPAEFTIPLTMSLDQYPGLAQENSVDQANA